MYTNANISDTESAIKGMNKMFFYAMNLKYIETTYSYPWSEQKYTEWLPEFISKIDWGCDMSHIIGIWKELSSEYGSYGEMFAFYEHLDNNNRRKLLQFIVEKYHTE